MKILQKIEFWLFSVPALIVSLGTIAHYGTWRMLWVFPVGYSLASFAQFSKNLTGDVLDGPWTNACRAEKWPVAYALVFLFPFYNWFVAAAFVDCVNLLIVWRYHGSMPLPFVYTIVYTVGFAVAALARTLRGSCDGGYGDVLIEAERWLLLAAIPVSAFVNLTPGLFALAMVVVGVLVVFAQGAVWYEKERERFLQCWEAEKRGQPFVRRRAKRWFPRPGVVYEPLEQPSSPQLARIYGKDFGEVRRMMTVLRVSPVAVLSLALLLAGGAVLIDRGHGLVTLTAFGAFALWFLHSAFIAQEKWDTWSRTLANGAPHAFCFFWLAAMIAWFGTDDLVIQIATGAFLVGCFEFPTRFMVRASSDRNPDALRIFATAGAVALAIWAHYRMGAPWYLCGICATVAAYPLVLARHFWPTKPIVRNEGSGMRGEKEASAAKDRRERKRQRQMEAFRRSRGSGTAT